MTARKPSASPPPPAPAGSPPPQADLVDRLGGLAPTAAVHHVVWAKVRGHPWWPVQVLPRGFGHARYGGALAAQLAVPSADTVIMYFGTHEVAAVSGTADTVAFAAGMARGYATASRRKPFVAGLADAAAFLAAGGVSPHGDWWTASLGGLPRAAQPAVGVAATNARVVWVTAAPAPAAPAQIVPDVAASALWPALRRPPGRGWHTAMFFGTYEVAAVNLRGTMPYLDGLRARADEEGAAHPRLRRAVREVAAYLGTPRVVPPGWWETALPPELAGYATKGGGAREKGLSRDVQPE